MKPAEEWAIELLETCADVRIPRYRELVRAIQADAIRHCADLLEFNHSAGHRILRREADRLEGK